MIRQEFLRLEMPLGDVRKYFPGGVPQDGLVYGLRCDGVERFDHTATVNAVFSLVPITIRPPDKPKVPDKPKAAELKAGEGAVEQLINELHKAARDDTYNPVRTDELLRKAANYLAMMLAGERFHRVAVEQRDAAWAQLRELEKS